MFALAMSNVINKALQAAGQKSMIADWYTAAAAVAATPFAGVAAWCSFARRRHLIDHAAVGMLLSSNLQHLAYT